MNRAYGVTVMRTRLFVLLFLLVGCAAPKKSENLSGSQQGALEKKSLIGSNDNTYSQSLKLSNKVRQSRKSAMSLGAGDSLSRCEANHWIAAVMDDGKLVKLEGGSIWEVDALDAIDSALWLPISNIVTCEDKLINTDDNETTSQAP
jgi:hypothetical protein